MQPIEYFYSAHSSYTWLGSARFREIVQAAGRNVVHKPVDLNRVLLGAGSTSFAERSEQFRNYFFFRELQRWSEYRNSPIFGRPKYHHHDPRLANCMIIAAQHQQLDPQPLGHAFLRAHWCHDADLADEPTLTRVATEAGFNGSVLLSEAQETSVKQEFLRNTEEAIERSMFGAPTYFVDGDMFYGQDRLELVERALQQPFRHAWSQVND
jgi:2-hydroxychromene-2-carboxylate isomerase